MPVLTLDLILRIVVLFLEGANEERQHESAEMRTARERVAIKFLTWFADRMDDIDALLPKKVVPK